jgi:hypothetical protein
MELKNRLAGDLALKYKLSRGVTVNAGLNFSGEKQSFNIFDHCNWHTKLYYDSDQVL